MFKVTVIDDETGELITNVTTKAAVLVAIETNDKGETETTAHVSIRSGITDIANILDGLETTCEYLQKASPRAEFLRQVKEVLYNEQ